MKALLRIVSHAFQRHWVWLKWPVAVSLLVYLAYRHLDGIKSLWTRDIGWAWLGISFAMCGGAIMLTMVRWYLLVWSLEFPFRLRDAMRLGFIGCLFNYIAPGSTGGDFFKAVMIAREQKTRRATAVATIFFDRMLGLWGLFLIGGLACLIPTDIVSLPRFHRIAMAFWIGTAGGLVGFLMMMIPAIPRSRMVARLFGVPVLGRAFRQLAEAVIIYQSRWRVVIVAAMVSAVSHAVMLSSFYFAAAAVHVDAPFPGVVEHFQFIPAAELVGVVIPMPGGVGALEEAIDFFYVMAGALKDDGFVTGLAYRMVSLAVAAVGAGYYLTARKEIQEALHEAEADTHRPPSAAAA